LVSFKDDRSGTSSVEAGLWGQDLCAQEKYDQLGHATSFGRNHIRERISAPVNLDRDVDVIARKVGHRSLSGERDEATLCGSVVA